MSVETSKKLALHGGPKAVTITPEEIDSMFHWPIVTGEDEQAVIEVLRAGTMSGNDITIKFEEEVMKWLGTKFALGYCNGTESLHAAMWACGARKGKEIICPSTTYWASATPALSLGATVNFADIDPDTLCIDPNDIEHRISKDTVAIAVVHVYGYPCDMDPIMAIAKKHNIKVIEDVSHAQGGLYKGRRLGTIGDIGCMSMMAGKSFAIGEGGMMVTDDRALWERCLSFGFYERTGASKFATMAGEDNITEPDLVPFKGMPMGGYKHRINQTCSAMGRVQLKYYDDRCAEIRKAMHYFWELLKDVPGLKAHSVDESTGSNMGGWYAPMGLYDSAELGGLPLKAFCEAVAAEGYKTKAGCNAPLHLHNVFHKADVYGDGKPTAVSTASRDVRQGPGSLPNAEATDTRVYPIPWFKHYRPEIIEQYANAFRKVAENADQLK